MGQTTPEEREKETTNSTSATTPISAVVHDRFNKVSDAEIQRAMARVMLHRDRLADLQSNWRTNLVRFAYMVTIIAMHQLSKPVQVCIKDLKGNSDAGLLGGHAGRNAITTIVHYASCELLNLLLSLAIVSFTRKFDAQPEKDMSSNISLLTALVSLVIGVYFNSSGSLGEGCIKNEIQTEDRSPSSILKRDFPISSIWCGVVIGAYYFMKVGMEKSEKNVELVNELEQKMDAAASTTKAEKRDVSIKSKSKSQ